MSEFITSFTNTIENKKGMKRYFRSHTEQWAIHILPTFDLYLETHSPIKHKEILKDGFSGLYLSISWLKWAFTFGIHKSIK